MAVDVRSRLATAEEDFLRSFTEGTYALEDFRDSWSTIVQSVNACSVDIDASLARATVSRVAVLASSLLEYDAEATAIKDSLVSDIFSQLTLADLTDTPQARPPSDPSSPPPTYIAPAYKWLLKNIHNPYPSKETKKLMSRGSGTSFQNIDAWFLNVRRRIGWTSISKKFFGGSKADTIAAAYRALVDDAPRPSSDAIDGEEDYTPLPGDIRMVFVEMQDAAQQLYAEKFTKSRLAGRLDGMVKDMTDEDRQKRAKERQIQKAEEKRRSEREREERKARDAERRWQEAQQSYPSPSPAPESSGLRLESPAFVESENEEDLTPPLPIAGRKRASSEDTTNEQERPMKRFRMLSSSGSSSSVDGLFISRQNSIEPLPSRSSSVCSTPPPSTPPEALSPSLPRPVAASKRKRRLSDASTEVAPKRPMPLVRPRLQVVSDPLPKSVTSVSPSIEESPILDWYQQFVDTPPAAAIDELDISGPIQLNMFDYSQFADYVSGGETSEGTDWEAQCNPLKTKDLLDLSCNPPIRVPSPFIDYDLPVPNLVHPDFDLDFCATTGWSQVDGIHSKSTPPGSTLEDTELNNLDGLSSLASLPSHQPVLSSASEESTLPNDVAFDPLSSIDWFSIIPQTIPPTQPVVPTTVEPITISPVAIRRTAYLGSNAESRAEKLRKYQEHVAQARQLEAELAFA
ncbi:hypothetical protein PTI98_001001 [Pleurotus ostreatus]|uniref:A mating type protein n=1 Tax=Pleurotus ostreatus (strain PC15) TaxID=1137138 RepID=A0A067NT12_PLEO1|nr:hypothetical protein PTI98_001001 [Pleurotus ostreatus]KDQ31069.1 A mating type protein [Pleurotus ostreatus PC15]